MQEFEVRLASGADLRRSLVIVGTPGMGLVGAIAAQHLARTLRMERVGSVSSARLPTAVAVRDGIAYSIIELHVATAECKVGVTCSRLVVVTSELPIPEDATQSFARSLAAWARTIQAPMILIPDGMEKDDSPGSDVYGVASDPTARRFLDALDVRPLDEGLVGGFAAAMLAAGQEIAIPVVALLGEVDPEAPDARAAVRIVSLLAQILPGLPLDIAPLLEEAEDIERLVRDMQDRARPRGEEAGEPMYR